ncbi:MAG: NACHT domain-containing protein [Bacteroidota bacterium]
MKKYGRYTGLVILVILLSLPISFIPDILAGDVEEWFKSSLGANYKWYILLFFIVGSIITTVLTVQIAPLFQNKNNRKKYKISWSPVYLNACGKARKLLKNQKVEDALEELVIIECPNLQDDIVLLRARWDISGGGAATPEAVSEVFELIKEIEKSFAEIIGQIQSLRTLLKSKYERRLSQKLGNRHPINIQTVRSKKGTSKFISAGFTSIPAAQVESEIVKIFEASLGRLLITGEAGGGKTCLLLQLALSIMEADKYAIPVVLDLIGWSPNNLSLRDWIYQTLSGRYGLSEKVLKNILFQTSAPILLDGLDETSRKFLFIHDPNDFEVYVLAKALMEHCKSPNAGFVITCREDYYMEINADLPINLQVKLKPLTTEQIIEDLERFRNKEPSTPHLIATIKRSKKIKKVVLNPFYLNIVQSLFHLGYRFEDMDLRTLSHKGLRKRILEIYVDRQLGGITEDNYLVKKRKKWLAFIASKIDRSLDRTYFELANLQYGFDFTYSKVDRAIGGAVINVIQYIPTAFVLTLYTFWGRYWQYSKWLILIGGGMMIISGAIDGCRPNTYLDLEVNGNTAIHWGKFGKYFRWVYPIVGIFFIILLGLSDLRFSKIEIVIFSFLYALPIGLFLTIFLLVSDGLVFSPSPSRDLVYSSEKPYQRFVKALLNFDLSIVQHVLIRFQLYKNGYLPLELVPFLNSMTRRYLLESDGGIWKFRHRLLHDYFREYWRNGFLDEKREVRRRRFHEVSTFTKEQVAEMENKKGFWSRFSKFFDRD